MQRSSVLRPDEVAKMIKRRLERARKNMACDVLPGKLANKVTEIF
jgi:hypothetical protein